VVKIYSAFGKQASCEFVKVSSPHQSTALSWRNNSSAYGLLFVLRNNTMEFQQRECSFTGKATLQVQGD
jgi:hypothetical protein